MSKKPRLLMTQSLLSAWQWQFKAFDPESAHREFLRTLRREKTRPNQAQLNCPKVTTGKKVFAA